MTTKTEPPAFDIPEPMPDFSPAPPVEPQKVLASIPAKPTKRSVRADSLSALQEMGLPSPVEFMVGIYCDDNIPRGERMDAAKHCAPYIHHKLNAIDLTTTSKTSHEEALDALDGEFTLEAPIDQD